MTRASSGHTAPTVTAMTNSVLKKPVSMGTSIPKLLILLRSTSPRIISISTMGFQFEWTIGSTKKP